MDNNIINEHSLISFSNDIENLDPIECDAKAIDLINYVESNNLDLSDYKYLHFYATFNNLLGENNLLKEEFKHGNDTEEFQLLNEDTIVLNEASSTNKRAKVTKLILESLALVDRSGLNVEKYKKFFDSMNDTEFKKYMDDFTKDPDKNFYLELLPNKSEPSIYDIENLLKKLNIPKEEYVYYRDNGFKDNPIRSRELCSVGYVNVRRLQQILSKKNTYSLDIDNRNTKTGQVSGDAKIARISDAELYGLTVFQADAAIKEFYSARADNMVAKNDMYSKISKYGYVYLDELSSDITKNQTLNTINTYLLGAGIKSDLVEDDSTKAADALKKQVIDAELKKMGGIVKESTILTEEEQNQPHVLDYYLVYTSNCDGKTLNPKVPSNFLTKNGFEDNKTSRVIACNSINGCLRAAGKNLKGKRLFVHKIVSDETPHIPGPSQVPYSRITGEAWFTKPVKLKCIGQIMVIGDDGKPGYPYTYGPNKQVGKLKGWRYQWVSHFDSHQNGKAESQPMVQSLGQFKKSHNEDTRITTSREYAYIAIDDVELKRGYINYEPTEEYNGKYVNLTLEGLERFIENNNVEGYNYYIKVPREQVEIMAYDEPTEGAIIKLPFAYDIEEYKNLNKRGDK